MSRNPCTFLQPFTALGTCQYSQNAVITGAWPADPCQMCHFFFLSESLYFSYVFFSPVLGDSGLEVLLRIQGFQNYALFPPCSNFLGIDGGGWETFIPWLSCLLGGGFFLHGITP